MTAQTGDRVAGYDNRGRLIVGTVEAVNRYSVGTYYDLRTDAGALVKVFGEKPIDGTPNQ